MSQDIDKAIEYIGEVRETLRKLENEREVTLDIAKQQVRCKCATCLFVRALGDAKT